LSSEKLIFKPYPKQEEFINAVFSGKYSFLCYGGAMGGGKSYVCLAILILLCKVYPKSKWCVIRESMPTLKRTTLETFKKLVPSNFVKSYNQQDQIYTFTNGSQILFMAEDYANDKDFDRFKGLEVNGFLLEQIEELQEELLKICFVRAGRWLIDKMPPKPLILSNVNPTLLWPKTKIFDRWQKNQLPDDWFYEPAKISDNPTLFNDVAYMHNVTAHLDDLTKRRMIDGDWSAFAVNNQFLYNFTISKHVIPSFEPNPHVPITVSFDFNVEPMTSIVSQRESLMRAVVFDELIIGTGSTEEMAEKIKETYWKWLYNIEITGDATGKAREKARKGNLTQYQVIKQILNLKDDDIKVRSANMPHTDSRQLCNSVLKHADFQITENCQQTILDAVYMKVDALGDLIKDKENPLHFGDNLRYTIGCHYPDFITNPSRYY
jgi:hypothetical protein